MEETDDKNFDITQTYLESLKNDPNMTMPVAAIKSLVAMLKLKQPSTLSELISLVKQNTEILKSSIPNWVSLSAGCDLFTRFVLRNTNLHSDFEAFKTNLVEDGELFIEKCKEIRSKVAEHGIDFIKDNDLILVHSYSRVVFELLLSARKKNLVRFRVIVTESRPTKKGYFMAKKLKESDIPVQVIVDGAVGYVIRKVDKIFVGAEGVAESGGIINHIGSYQIGCLAKINKKPFYVVAESHKFVRLFPLLPDDLPDELNKSQEGSKDDTESDILKRQILDFTPHEYITALITDLGVLTSSFVSDELIKIWYD